MRTAKIIRVLLLMFGNRISSIDGVTKRATGMFSLGIPKGYRIPGTKVSMEVGQT